MCSEVSATHRRIGSSNFCLGTGFLINTSMVRLATLDRNQEGEGVCRGPSRGRWPEHTVDIGNATDIRGVVALVDNMV